jgi:hypothetical protein
LCSHIECSGEFPFQDQSARVRRASSKKYLLFGISVRMMVMLESGTTSRKFAQRTAFRSGEAQIQEN